MKYQKLYLGIKLQLRQENIFPLSSNNNFVVFVTLLEILTVNVIMLLIEIPTPDEKD